MESVTHFSSMEQARNAALRWLEERGVVFGPHREIEIGRLGVLAGSEVGVSASEKPYWRLRLDYDDKKGPHYNAEHGTGHGREKAAFSWPGVEATMARIVRRREPR